MLLGKLLNIGKGVLKLQKEELEKEPEHYDEEVEDDMPEPEIMRQYAFINEEGVCYSISRITADLPASDTCIHLEDGHNVQLRDKYIHGEWIPAPPLEPLPEPVPLDQQFDELRTVNELLGQQLVERELENLALRADNELLGQQLVNIEIRLMEGGM